MYASVVSSAKKPRRQHSRRRRTRSARTPARDPRTRRAASRRSAPSPQRSPAAGGSGARETPGAPSPATARPRSSTSAASPRTTAGRGPRPASRARTSARNPGTASAPDPQPPGDSRVDGVVRPLAAMPGHQTRRASLPIAARQPLDLAHADTESLRRLALPQTLLHHVPDHRRPIRFLDTHPSHSLAHFRSLPSAGKGTLRLGANRTRLRLDPSRGLGHALQRVIAFHGSPNVGPAVEYNSF